MKSDIVITEPGAYRVSAWKSVDRNGNPFIKCWLEKVDQTPNSEPTRQDNLELLRKTREDLERKVAEEPPPTRAWPHRHANPTEAEPVIRKPLDLAPPPPSDEEDLPF